MRSDGVSDEQKEAVMRSDLAIKRRSGEGRCDRNSSHVGNLYRVGPMLVCSGCFDGERVARQLARESHAANAKENAHAALDGYMERLWRWGAGTADTSDAAHALNDACNAVIVAWTAGTLPPPEVIPANANGDDLDALERCAWSWEPEVRLLGNVRAKTIRDLCAELQTRRREDALQGDAS